MSLKPENLKHEHQILAGISGRKRGHDFEIKVAESINTLHFPINIGDFNYKHIHIGNPALNLLKYICKNKDLHQIIYAFAIPTGILATNEDSNIHTLIVDNKVITKCKSDLIVKIIDINNNEFNIGISIKQCNNKNPTNAQLFFTTATGFTNLLRNNNIRVSDKALLALKQFCGDNGYRPLDKPEILINRLIDHRRYFWEEIDFEGRIEWENIFEKHQDNITRLLLQKAYSNDPFIPEFILHKTHKSNSWETTEVAMYSIEEFIRLSHDYSGFITKSYRVKKGSFKDPEGVQHLAPRFGVIQMQRGGQKQHPEQLQFNLECGYFYKF